VGGRGDGRSIAAQLSYPSLCVLHPARGSHTLSFDEVEDPHEFARMGGESHSVSFVESVPVVYIPQKT